MIEKTHTEEEMTQIMEEEWDKILQTLEEKGVQISEKNVTIKKNGQSWTLNARMQLVEQAVKKVKNTTQQIPVAEDVQEAAEE